MSTLEIKVPAIHNIFFTPYGESYTPSLPGVIYLPSACNGAKTTASFVSVSLTRFVTLSTKRRTITKLVKRKQQSQATYAEVVAYAEIPCSTKAATGPERNRALSLGFSLAIPTSLCPTTHTPIMTTSYALTAHAKTEGGERLEATCELQIRRTMIPNVPLVFEHFRKFQRMPCRTRLFLSPEHLPNLTSKGTFNGTVLLEGPLVQKGRPSEIKVVVVREVRWSVTEAVEISHKHPSPQLGSDFDKTYMRTICKGRVRGNWMPEDLALWKEDKESLMQTKVPFRILAQKATNDMELHCPQFRISAMTGTLLKETSGEQIGVFISHQLRVEIVTGEDTFVQQTTTLVDRKPARHCLGATYPLLIGHIAYDTPMPAEAPEAESELPGYEDSGMPPAYDV